MKIASNILITSIAFLIFNISCKKEVHYITQSESEKFAINDIRKIVGEKAIITSSSLNTTTLSPQSYNQMKETRLNLEQLKEVYAFMNDKSMLKLVSLIKLSTNDAQIIISSNSISAPNDNNDPLRPGLYKAQFKGPTSLYNTTVYFTIGNNRAVVGFPSLSIKASYFFNPYSFQITNTSSINFNPYGAISQFTIIGSLSMNVGIGNLSFNILNRDIIFDLTVSASEGTIALK